MKRFFCFAVCIVSISFATAPILSAYFVQYKEQYYELYHIRYKQYPDECLENIYWLEKAINADFCNPLYALGKINNKKEWEKYRYLFMMHLNLKLVEQHLRLGSKFDKQVAYFYNAPWKEQNIESLKTAEECYRTALFYWKEATIWAEKANVRKYQFLFLTDLQDWEDERERIGNSSLNYERTIRRALHRLADVRNTFMDMSDSY